MVPCLLPFLVNSVIVVGGVEIGCHYGHFSLEVVIVVAEVLLQQLIVPAVVLPDARLSGPMGIVLWGLEDAC